MRRLLLAGGFLHIAMSAAAAQSAHTTREAYVCVDPGAVRALSNPAEPRRSDQQWVSFVARDGSCGTLPPGTRVTKSGNSNELSTIQFLAQGRVAQLYIEDSSLAIDPPKPPPEPVQEASIAPPPEPAPAETGRSQSGSDLARLVEKLHGAARELTVPPPPPREVPVRDPAPPLREAFSAWRFSHPAGTRICRLDSETAPGHTVILAAPDHPGVLRLLMQKRSWQIPADTAIPVTMAFADGGHLPLQGVGAGTDIAFDLDDAGLKAWLHGIDAGAAGTLSFGSGNEPAWRVDLRGMPNALASLRKCAVALRLSLPAPAGVAPTQPFNAGQPATQPFGASGPAPPVAPTAAPVPVAGVPDAAPPPVPVPSGPGTIAWGDIPRLANDFGLHGLAPAKTKAPLFAAVGVFQDFTSSDPAGQGNENLWMVVVQAAPGDGTKAFCFLSAYRGDLARLKKGDRVRISGRVVVPMQGSVALEHNCAVAAD